MSLSDCLCYLRYWAMCASWLLCRHQQWEYYILERREGAQTILSYYLIAMYRCDQDMIARPKIVDVVLKEYNLCMYVCVYVYI